MGDYNLCVEELKRENIKFQYKYNLHLHIDSVASITSTTVGGLANSSVPFFPQDEYLQTLTISKDNKNRINNSYRFSNKKNY